MARGRKIVWGASDKAIHDAFVDPASPSLTLSTSRCNLSSKPSSGTEGAGDEFGSLSSAKSPGDFSVSMDLHSILTKPIIKPE